MQIRFDESSYAHLLDHWYREDKRAYQAVHPRDLLTIIRALCSYEGRDIFLTPQLIDEACDIYFVKH